MSETAIQTTPGDNSMVAELQSELESLNLSLEEARSKLGDADTHLNAQVEEERMKVMRLKEEG